MIPIQGIAVQNNKVEKAFKAFFSIQLKANQMAYMHLGIHSNIIIRTADKTILLDPSLLIKPDLEILKNNGVDLVVYTHGHGDHFEKGSAINLFKICRPYIAIDPSLAPDLEKDIPQDKLIVAAPGTSVTASGIAIDTIKGKHIGPIMLFRLTIDGLKIFHGGDSAYVPLSTMASDIAFVPTGSPSPTCNPQYAFKMVQDISPQIAVPMHGEDSQHQQFVQLMEKNLSGINVMIPEPFVPNKVNWSIK